MTEYPADTIVDLLHRGAADRPAIGAPGRPWLTHGGLRDLTQRTIGALNGMGIGRNDRVAIVAPNGPEMASAFVAIAAGATTAPLNPAYKTEEFEFYLSDLNATRAGHPARHGEPGARGCHGSAHPDHRTDPGDRRAGRQLHAGPAIQAVRRTGARRRGCMRRTSHWCCTPPAPRRGRRSCRCGISTSQPPPIISAETLTLTPDDVCLNIMPLFHIHGLIAATLSSLAAGAAVCCTPRLQRVPLLHLVRRSAAELVHRRADHAPGDPEPGRPQRSRDHGPDGCVSSDPPPPRCRRR